MDLSQWERTKYRNKMIQTNKQLSLSLFPLNEQTSDMNGVGWLKLDFTPLVMYQLGVYELNG